MLKVGVIKKILACLLCVTIISGSINVTDSYAAVTTQKETVIDSVEENPFARDSVIFAAAYIDELKSIKGLWEHDDLKSTDVFVRYDDALEFVLFKTTETRDVDIPVSTFNNFIDIRVVLNTTDGDNIKSDIVTIQKSNGSFETVRRDSDADGIADGYEIWDVGTDPFNPDTDGDGFPDGYEINVLVTSPLEWTEDVDFDGDGLTNLEEMRLGTHPYLADGDFDGLSDSMDTDKFITANKHNRIVDYDVKLYSGEFDKVYRYTNADDDSCTIVINSLTKSVKYYRVGDRIESFYFYNADNNLVAQINKTEDNISADTYAYDGKNVAYIGHEGTSYHFKYNENGDIVETRIGDQIIANHEYTNSSPVKTVFANNQVIEYSYNNNKDAIKEINVNGSLYFQNEYDKNGNLTVQKDVKNDINYSYEYDTDSRLTKIEGDNGSSIEYLSTKDGDTANYVFEGEEKKQSTKHLNEGIITDLLIGGELKQPNSVNENRQSLILKNEKNKIVYETNYTKEDNKIITNTNNGKIHEVNEFDSNGNIIGVKQDGKKNITYIYNSKNQLIQSNNYTTKETIVYEYDDNNIVSEKYFSNNYISSDNLINANYYSYNDTNWKDLLTAYNNEKILYDAIGNPTHYLGNMNLTWDNGRELSKLSKPGIEAEYSYNYDGIRIKKEINGIQTNYLLDGTKIIAEETSGNTIWYSYDSNDLAIGFEYKGKVYYYGKNIQNDVVNIYGSNGDILVEYTYDDWGNVIDISGDKELGNINKFRYRTYYYDDESGFYYLQSRYYDSETGRFINADRKLASFNAFAYCDNNPINYVDYTGEDATYFIIGLVFVGFALLLAFFVAANFMRLWEEYYAPYISQLANGLISIGSSISAAVIQGIWNSANGVSLYIASKLREYTVAPSFSSQYQVHHIIAERAAEAAPARAILDRPEVKIDVNSTYNLVPIKTGIHAHLHTSLYYNMVNSYIINAYYVGSTSDKWTNIIRALNEIRVFLQVLSNGSPF